MLSEYAVTSNVRYNETISYDVNGASSLIDLLLLQHARNWTYLAAGMAVSPVSTSPVNGSWTLTTLVTVTLSPDTGMHTADTLYRPA